MKTFTPETIEEIAGKFRATYGLGAAEPINAKTILRRLNILTMYRPMSAGLLGLSVKSTDGRKLFMLVNSASTRGQQHFTIAHELFHLLYEKTPKPHFYKDLHTKDASEKNADMFASCLLMPRQGILMCISEEDIVSHSPSIATLLKMEQLYGVAHQDMVQRLRILKLVSEKWAKDMLKVDIAQTASEYGAEQTLLKPGNENLFIGDFGSKARKLFEDGKISEGHYMELLNLIGNGQD